MKLAIGLLSAVSIIALAGCNTMHGAGQDIKSIGGSSTPPAATQHHATPAPQYNGGPYSGTDTTDTMHSPDMMTTPEQDQARQDRLDKQADLKAQRAKDARHVAAETAKQDKADRLEQANQTKKDQADHDAAVAQRKADAAKAEADRANQAKDNVGKDAPIPASRPQSDQPAQQR